MKIRYQTGNLDFFPKKEGGGEKRRERETDRQTKRERECKDVCL
jgi:hypothetical protein